MLSCYIHIILSVLLSFSFENDHHLIVPLQGHGFRKELALMLEDLKPAFVRFPGDRLATVYSWFVVPLEFDDYIHYSIFMRDSVNYFRKVLIGRGEE